MLACQTRRHSALPVYLQVVIALQFYATGCFQLTCGDLVHVDQSTVSRTVKRVSAAIAVQRHNFIKFPETVGEVRLAMESFYEIDSFPHVVGAIDGVHIRIANPGGDDAMRFINRKGWYSFNCQVACTSDMMITNIVARWQGSAHDARVFLESSLNRRFEDGELRGVLIGDAGYPCLPYLMTPIARPRNDSE